MGPGLMRDLQERTLRMAQDDLRRENYRQAWLRLEQAVQSNPGDFMARRQLAQFYDEAGLPQALDEWRILVRLEPGNDRNRFGLALCALRAGDPAAAQDALAGVSAGGRLNETYHRLAAGIAMRSGDQGTLASELAALSHLEPNNPRALFNQAALALAGGAPGQAAAATAQLEELARGSPMRIRATLALIQEASRTGKAGGMEALAERILPRNSSPGLLSLWALPPRGMPELVAYMKAQPNPEAGDAVRLAEWLCRQGQSADSLFWLDRLDPSVLATPEVQAARATCLVQMMDWRGLEAAVRAGAWGRIPDDALDLAFAAHAQSEWLHPEHAKDTWNDALDVASRSRDGLGVMLLLATEFQWRDEAEAVLWRMAKAAPADVGNWEKLAALATAEGSTQKLLEVYQGWVGALPANKVAAGGVAWLSALLDRSAEGVMEAANASNAGFVAAEALRLHRSGRGMDGLALLDSLPDGARSDLRPALVRGLLLSDLGQRDESERVLALIPEAQLLPEERALLEAAHARNGGAGPS
jgi:Tfp pilus assembly protein PilF